MSGPDYIPMVVPKNCGLFYILAELFNKCLNESYFPDGWKVVVGRWLLEGGCWKVVVVGHTGGSCISKNVGQSSAAKNYRPVSLLFRSSQSTADLLTVVSDSIARDFNRSGVTRTVALNISKAFDRV